MTVWPSLEGKGKWESGSTVKRPGSLRPINYKHNHILLTSLWCCYLSWLQQTWLSCAYVAAFYTTQHNTTMSQRCWCISNCHIASASVNSRSLWAALSFCLNRDKVRGGHAHRVASAMQGTMKSGMSYCTERWEEDRDWSATQYGPHAHRKNPGLHSCSGRNRLLTRLTYAACTHNLLKRLLCHSLVRNSVKSCGVAKAFVFLVQTTHALCKVHVNHLLRISGLESFQG